MQKKQRAPSFLSMFRFFTTCPTCGAKLVVLRGGVVESHSCVPSLPTDTIPRNDEHG
jgi:hypothetical protein